MKQNTSRAAAIRQTMRHLFREYLQRKKSNPVGAATRFEHARLLVAEFRKLPILQRLEIYPSPFVARGQKRECYDARVRGGAAVPATVADTLIIDLFINAKYHGFGKTNAADALMYYYYCEPEQMRGYRPFTFCAFVRSLTTDELNELYFACADLLKSGRDYWHEETERRLLEFPAAMRQELRDDGFLQFDRHKSK